MFEFDGSGHKYQQVGGLAGERLIVGSVDLKKEALRAYAPAAHVAPVRRELTKILGRALEVLPLEDFARFTGSTATVRTTTLSMVLDRAKSVNRLRHKNNNGRLKQSM